MKVFLALGVRKSVPEKAKSGTLGLVNFGFLDFADFAAVDRFLIIPQTSPPPTPPLILLDKP